MYRITNGQVEKVTSLPNVSGAEIYLQSLTVEQRQAMGIFARFSYGDYTEPLSSVADDCIYVPTRKTMKVEEQPYDISKIGLKEQLKEIGLWDEFITVLKSDPDKYEDFDLAGSLKSTDPRVLSMKQICVGMFGLTVEFVDAMLKRCKAV